MKNEQIARLLEKIELAARRAVADRWPEGVPKGKSALQAFHDELAKMIKELRDQ